MVQRRPAVQRRAGCSDRLSPPGVVRPGRRGFARGPRRRPWCHRDAAGHARGPGALPPKAGGQPRAHAANRNSPGPAEVHRGFWSSQPTASAATGPRPRPSTPDERGPAGAPGEGCRRSGGVPVWHPSCLASNRWGCREGGGARAWHPCCLGRPVGCEGGGARVCRPRRLGAPGVGCRGGVWHPGRLVRRRGVPKERWSARLAPVLPRVEPAGDAEGVVERVWHPGLP